MMDYFPHDTHAMSDDRLLALRIRHGLETVAVYWVVLEKIYADEKPFSVSETNVEATSVLLRLGIGFDELEKHVSAMVEVGLLDRDENDADTVMSARAQAQIEELCRKREIARQNGKAGGRKPTAQKRGNRRGTKVGSNDKPTSGDIKTLNGIGFDKQNQIPSGGADAEDSAPHPSESTMAVLVAEHQGEKGRWKCNRCGSNCYPSDDGFRCARCGYVGTGTEWEPAHESSPCPPDIIRVVKGGASCG